MALLIDIDWRTLPNAPAPGTRLCSLRELQPDVVSAFRFAATPDVQAFQMIAHLHEGSVNAYVNQCPHHWLPMQRADGVFLRWSETELMCAHHSAVFDLSADGKCIMGPCQGSNLIRVPVRVVDDEVRIGP